MTLKSDDVRSIAHLARLHIEDDAVERYVDDLSSILDLVDAMNRVDSSGVAPLSNPLDASQRLRADEITEIDQRDKFQGIAPDVADGFYRVPRVIE
jgi:aspartyl-tRNA(Asn)/glutamyl-tRNA(Gln) amidotransferase subunit C